MHLPIPILAALLPLATAFNAGNSTVPITQALRLQSYNIRWAAPSDGALESNWTIRGPLLISQLAASVKEANAQESIPIIGLQEALASQISDIKKGLWFVNGNEWAHIGIGRDDGAEAGEHVQLLYRPDQLRLLDSKYSWLSETPDKPSIGWGGGYKRTAAIGVFEVIHPEEDTKDDEGVIRIGQTGHEKVGAVSRKFIAACTHLDNESPKARVEGARQVLRMLVQMQQKWGGGLPVFLMGDFNSAPGQDGHMVVRDSQMLVDSRELAGESKRFGPEGTYLGFKEDDHRKEWRIDYVFLGPSSGWSDAQAKDKWDVKRYEVLDHVVNGTLATDHRSVRVDVDITFDQTS